MSLSLDDVKKIARLSRLELPEDDLVRMQSQLSAILDYVAQLNELDTSNVAELAHPLDIENVFRPDEPTPSLPPDAALQNAPKHVVIDTTDKDGRPLKEHYFGVPAVFDTDEPVSH